MLRRIVELRVERDCAHVSLETMLMRSIPALGSDRVRHLARIGAVIVNGQRMYDVSHRLETGAKLHVGIDPSQDRPFPTFPLAIVGRDDDVLVVNKAAGQHVQGTPFGDRGTLLRESELAVQRLARDEQCTWSGFIALAHRIDRLASGLVAIALNRRTASILGKQLHKRSMTRRYFALVDGVVKEDRGTWDAPLQKTGPRVRVVRNGKRAITKYRVRERMKGTLPGRAREAELTLLELSLVTGRTHQIRVHCAHADHAIVGDTFYGGMTAPRMFLHAYKLVFVHPSTGMEMQYQAYPDWDVLY